MRRCSNFSCTLGVSVHGLPPWNTSCPRGSRLIRAAEGLATVGGEWGRLQRQPHMLTGRSPGAQLPRVEDDSTAPPSSQPPRALATAGPCGHPGHPGMQRGERWVGAEGGMAVGHQGSTHRSCASSGVKPSRPLPAVPLLEHAASCKELLGGTRTLHTQAHPPMQSRERPSPPLYTPGSREERDPRTQSQAPSPGFSSSPKLPPHPRTALRIAICTMTFCCGRMAAPHSYVAAHTPCGTVFGDRPTSRELG